MHKIISKNKGFTLIELLAVIVILAIIALIATPIIIGLIDNARKEAFKDTGYGIIKSAEFLYADDILKGINEEVSFSYVDGEETSNPLGKQLNYNGTKPKTGVIVLNDKGDVAVAIYDGKYCAQKSYQDGELTLIDVAEEDCLISLPNAPVLATGMTPIKWNGTDWINTTENDKEWYNYTSIDKKWANARTEDGSMWVWIPRYIYKITNGWHNNQTGTIKIQFSNGTNDDWNSSVIGSINTDTTANASNNTWTNHPAFTFGTDEVTGIWVAKFEASDDGSNNIKVAPNLIAWNNINIDSIFLETRSMETNSLYGWGTSGNGIDTHFIKNVEWGAVAYLSKSSYGKNDEEIWINPADNLTTGCAGDSVSSDVTVGCLNAYNTENGLKSSTTGTIYGIYGMSGGAREYTASYVDNGDIALTTNGNSLITASNKYKDEYTVIIDTNVDNYNEAANNKGDAIYETSNNVNGSFSWFTSYSQMPSDITPFFTFGARYTADVNAGIFSFDRFTGVATTYMGFRPTLVVGEGL